MPDQERKPSILNRLPLFPMRTIGMHVNATATTASTSNIDIVEELRLRRWARENYLPPEKRNGSLNVIALDEMRRRDAELIIGNRSREPQSNYVPLAPIGIPNLHLPHMAPRKPNMGTGNHAESAHREFSETQFASY